MKKKIQSENFLEKIPVRSSFLNWSADEDGLVTLEIENTGFFNRVAQKVFHRPKFSYVHLDKTGSFVWPVINGEDNVHTLGQKLEAEFGEEAHPLYERLAKYMQILDSYGFIKWN